MFFIEPCRDGIRRRSEDHLDSSGMQTVQNALHPGKLEVAVTWLPTAPRRFAHANHRNPDLLHQFHVFIEPLIGHVFGVIGHAIQDCFHFVRSESRRALWWCRARPCLALSQSSRGYHDQRGKEPINNKRTIEWDHWPPGVAGATQSRAAPVNTFNLV